MSNPIKLGKEINIRNRRKQNLAKKIIKAHLIKMNYATIEYLRDWVWTVSNLLKGKMKNKPEDIRQYFIRKSNDKKNK